MIAVIGATGLLGRPVAEQLLNDGFRVRILTRNPVFAKDIMDNRYEYAFADVRDYDTLHEALEGCSMLHINLNTDHDSEPEDVLHEGLANVAQAAEDVGIEKISIIAGDWEPDPNHSWDRRAAFSKGILALEAGSVPTVLWQATWFFESLDYFVLEDRALMVGLQPLTWHFVAAADFAKMVSTVLEEEQWEGHRRFTVHGPEGLRMFDALKHYCNLLRPDLPVEQMSIADVKTYAATHEDLQWLDGFADFMAVFEKHGETGNPAAAHKLLREPLTTLDEWCQQQLA